MKKMFPFFLALFLLNSFSAYPFSDTLDVATPAGSDSPTQGDDRIREMKRALVERLQVDHNFPASGSTYDAASVGVHNKVTFFEQGSDPSAATTAVVCYAKANGTLQSIYCRYEDGTIKQITDTKSLLLLLDAVAAAPTTGAMQGAVYTKVVSGQPELFFKEQSEGDEVQITSGGSLNLTYTDASDSTSSNESTTNSSYQDTALSITFTVGKQGLTFASFDGSGLSDSGKGTWAITVDGTPEKEISYTPGSGGPTVVPLPMFWHGVLSAGSHTIKIQIKNAGGGGSTSIKGAETTARLKVSHPS